MTREINPQRELVTRIRNKQSRDNEKIEREKKKRAKRDDAEQLGIMACRNIYFGNIRTVTG